MRPTTSAKPVSSGGRVVSFVLIRPVLQQGHDASGDSLQFGIDLLQRTRRLEDVEMPIEGNLVADFGLLVVDPGVRRMRQDFALEVDFHIFTERHIFCVAQIAVRLRLAFQLALRA